MYKNEVKNKDNTNLEHNVTLKISETHFIRIFISLGGGGTSSILVGYIAHMLLSPSNVG